jgi:alkanesulfonate monooxygenase SsuD/methylene tetrahydromethanopterin reductase-like flavin-dependent oxidoreductase (luciferase family)
MSGLEFGILTTPIYGAETSYRVQLQEHRELVEASEALGFSVMSAGQHFLGSELRYYQPVPYLAHLSQYAPSMKVLTGIMLLSMVNPVELAEQIATLDVVTDGRCVFGVGLGYSEREFRAFGVNPKNKISRFEEGLDLIKQLWSGEEVTYEGRYWSVEGVTPAVLPAQQPRPPIWIGGQSSPAIRRAARLGDAWYAPPFPSHDEVVAMRRLYLQAREEAGLSTEGAFPLRRELIVADTRAEATRIAAQRSQLRYETYRKWGLSGENTPTGHEGGMDVEKQFLLGSPEELVDRLGHLQETLGMTHFMYKSHWQGLPHREAMTQLERFGTEVLPKLRG